MCVTKADFTQSQLHLPQSHEKVQNRADCIVEAALSVCLALDTCEVCSHQSPNHRPWGKKKKREYYIIGTLVCDVCSFNFKKTRWTFKLQLGLLSGQNWLPLSYDTLLSPTSSSIPHHHLEPSVLNEFSSRVSRKLVKTKGTQSRAL